MFIYCAKIRKYNGNPSATVVFTLQEKKEKTLNSFQFIEKSN